MTGRKLRFMTLIDEFTRSRASAIRRLIPALLQYNPTLTTRELAFTVMADRLMSI